MTERVLLVDDEQSILDGYRRNLRKHFDIDTAGSPSEAMSKVETSGPYAAVVSDLQMPEMSGIELLTHVRTAAPDTVRIMLTGQADLDVSIDAVNTGNVFRFLTKPCDPQALACALDAGLEQYRLVRAERDLLENTLQGAVRMLTDVLSMLEPDSHALAGRVQSTVAQLCAELDIASWEIELAAMLCQLGNVTLPSETARKLGRGDVLSVEEKTMVARAPEAGARLLAHVPRLERVAHIIADQDEPPPGPLDDDPDAEVVIAGTSIVHVAVRYQRLLAAGTSSEDALEQLRRTIDDDFRLHLLALLGGPSDPERRWREDALPLSDVTPNMLLAQDVHAVTGILLLRKDEVVTRAHLERLRTFAAGVGVDEPIRVLISAHQRGS